MPVNRIILVEYFTTDDLTYIFGIRSDWDQPEVVTIEQPLSEIRKYVTDKFGIEEATEDKEHQTTADKVRHLNLDEWQSLFSPFIEPIVKWADPEDYLYLVPHDVLHYLPLHVLKVEGDYLINRNPVVYTPSASVLKYCKEKRKGRKEKALVLGDSAIELNLSLPFAREEALQVADMFGTHALIGSDVRKTTIKEKLKNEEIDILHLACHGYFHPSQPLKSGILMAPELNEEQQPDAFYTSLNDFPVSRYLTAEEFLGMEIHTDLVTLSSCETGINKLRPGDELFGFMRSLIYAGTPSVVMSLWGVDDIATEILMVKFYQNLKSEFSKVKALQLAQQEIMNMTAEKVIAYYQEKLDRIANIGNELRKSQISQCINQAHLEVIAARINEGNQIEDLSHIQIFKNPFYWAPFILVGDWK